MHRRIYNIIGPAYQSVLIEEVATYNIQINLLYVGGMIKLDHGCPSWEGPMATVYIILFVHFSV